MVSRNTLLRTVFCAMLLQGCAAPPYQPPVVGKTSALAIRSTVAAGIVTAYAFEDAEACKRPQVIVSSAETGVSDLRSKTRIRAEQPFSLWLKITQAEKYCDLVVTFDAAPYRSYEAVLSQDTTHCGLAVYDITGAFPEPEPSLRKRIWGRAGGGYCQPGPEGKNEQEVSGTDLGNGSISNVEGVTLQHLKGLLPAK